MASNNQSLDGSAGDGSPTAKFGVYPRGSPGLAAAHPPGSPPGICPAPPPGPPPRQHGIFPAIGSLLRRISTGSKDRRNESASQTQFLPGTQPRGSVGDRPFMMRRFGTPCAGNSDSDAVSDKVRLAQAILKEAAHLPISRRHELLIAAKDTPQFAAVFVPGAAALFKDHEDLLRELQTRVRNQDPAPPEAEEPQAAAAAVVSTDAEGAQPMHTARAAEGGGDVAATMTPGEAPVAAVQEDALRLSVVPEYEQYGVASGETVRAVISLKAMSEVRQRARVALSCVLDRSGSMSGGRIELVRETVHFLIDQLTDEDYLGIISYASGVREDLPLVRMTAAAKTLAHEVLDAMRADGSTALYSGLVEGVRQQMTAETELRGVEARVVHSCFLFTDGDATDGPKRPQDIISGLAALQAPTGQHVTVHTFGFGASHSVDLLQQVADAQSGIYYYIACSEDIPGGFGDALGGLLAVVAKDVKFVLRTAPGVTLSTFRSGGRVVGAAGGAAATHRRPTSADANSRNHAVPTAATFNDMFAEETRECLVVLTLPPATLPVPLLEVDLSYTDVAAGSSVKRTATLRVVRLASERPPDQLPAELVFVTAARFETLDAIEAAQRAAVEGDGIDVTVAHGILDQHLERLQSAPRALQQSSQLTALGEQTRLARSSIAPKSKFMQEHAATVASTVQALKQQRIGTSTMQAPDSYAVYDHKCKSAFRMSTGLAVNLKNKTKANQY